VKQNRRSTGLRLVLAAVEPSLADAWERFCGDMEFVTVHRGSILDVSCDAVVSPANSYGFMDGGIDAMYMDHFGPEIQLRVRRQISEHHVGEPVVGAAAIVETGHSSIPFLIAAPTMRVPMVLRDSANVYLAGMSGSRCASAARSAHGRLDEGERLGLEPRLVAL
jgi:O-acetyl-ADP-ribose deacetylase (regulator of RNase III)